MLAFLFLFVTGLLFSGRVLGPQTELLLSCATATDVLLLELDIHYFCAVVLLLSVYYAVTFICHHMLLALSFRFYVSTHVHLFEAEFTASHTFKVL